VVGLTGVSPFLGLLVVVPVMLGLGYAIQRALLARVLDRGVLPPLLVTFGLSIIIQNALLQLFSADDRRLEVGGITTASIAITGQVAIGWYPLIVFVVGVLAIVGLQFLFSRTALGRAFRATADDPETARLMGINHRHTYAVAVAIAFGIIGLAGVFLGIRTTSGERCWAASSSASPTPSAARSIPPTASSPATWSSCSCCSRGRRASSAGP